MDGKPSRESAPAAGAKAGASAAPDPAPSPRGPPRAPDSSPPPRWWSPSARAPPGRAPRTQRRSWSAAGQGGAGAAPRSGGASGRIRWGRPARHIEMAPGQPPTNRQAPRPPPRSFLLSAEDGSWPGPQASMWRARRRRRRNETRDRSRWAQGSRVDPADETFRTPTEPEAPRGARLMRQRHREDEGAARAGSGLNDQVAVMHPRYLS